MAKKPSKQAYLNTVKTSLNPALLSKSKFPFVENGSKIPLSDLLLLII